MSRGAPLTPGADPRDLVPGDMAVVEDLARDLLALARDAGRARMVLRGVRGGTWSGPAEEEFRQRLAELPDRLLVAEESFRAAGAALFQHIDVVSAARAEARAAVALFDQALLATRAWAKAREQVRAASASLDPFDVVGIPAPLLFTADPGTDDLAAAERRLAAARAEVECSAVRVAAVLRRAARAAPETPGFSLGWQLGQVGIGVAESTWETAKLAARLTPLSVFADPKGQLEWAHGNVRGLMYGVQHPVEFGKAMVDYETFRTNPARALGHVLPDAAATIATGGAASAVRAGRGVSQLRGAATGAGRAAYSAPFSRLWAVPSTRPVPRGQWRPGLRDGLLPRSPLDPVFTSRDVVIAAEEMAAKRRVEEEARQARADR